MDTRAVHTGEPSPNEKSRIWHPDQPDTWLFFYMCETVFPLNALFPEEFPHHSLCLSELRIRPCKWEEFPALCFCQFCSLWGQCCESEGGSITATATAVCVCVGGGYSFHENLPSNRPNYFFWPVLKEKRLKITPKS